mgnify:CR=1 FL=1
MEAKQKIIKDAKMRELMYKELVSRAKFTATISLIAMVSILISYIAYLIMQAQSNVAPSIVMSAVDGMLLVIALFSVTGWYFARKEEYSKMLQVN